MATLAEMLVASGLQSSQKSPISGAVEGFVQGAQLAQNAERLSQQREQVEMAKQQAYENKIGKVASLYETASKLPDGKAKQAFIKNVIPKTISGLGLETEFPPDTMQLLNANPEVVAFLKARILDPTSGLTLPSLLSNLQNSQWVAEQIPEAIRAKAGQELEPIVTEGIASLEAAEAQRIDYIQSEKRAQLAAQRAAIARDEEALTSYKRKLGDQFGQYKLAGGKASVQTNLEQLDTAASDLLTGKSKTGTVLLKAIGGSDKAVDILAPEVSAARDKIYGAVVSSLRPILGAQFAEAEGKRILSLSFNTALSSEENARRVVQELNKIKTMVLDKEKEFVKYGLMDKSEMTNLTRGGKRSFRDLSPAAQDAAIKKLAQQLKITEQEARQKLEAK